MKDSISNKLKQILKAIISLSIIFIVWEIAAKKINAPLILPLVENVFISLKDLFFTNDFYKCLIASWQKCFITFFISLIVSVVLAEFSSRSNFFYSFNESLLSFIKAVPVISIILLSLFWLKTNFIPVLAAVLMAVPVMTEGIFSGLKCAEEKKALWESFKFNSFQKMLFIKIPESLSHSSVGIKGGCGMIWKVLASAEVLVLPRYAIGRLLQKAQVNLESQKMFALTLVIILSSYIFCLFISLLLKANRPLLHLIYRIYFDAACKVKETCDEEKFSGVEIKNFSLEYKTHGEEKNAKNIYSDFSIKFNKEEITSIVAESGTGKSTLLKFISNTLPENTLCTGEKNIKDSQKISYLSQVCLVMNELTVLQNILLMQKNFYSKEAALFNAKKILLIMNLSEKADLYPVELSGGEKQRLSLALVFSYPSKILLLDEPFNSQDLKIKFYLYKKLLELNKIENKQIIFVTHDIDEAVSLSDRIVFLEGQPVKILVDEKLSSEENKIEVKDKIKKILLENVE